MLHGKGAQVALTGHLTFTDKYTESLLGAFQSYHSCVEKTLEVASIALCLHARDGVEDEQIGSLCKLLTMLASLRVDSFPSPDWVRPVANAVRQIASPKRSNPAVQIHIRPEAPAGLRERRLSVSKAVIALALSKLLDLFRLAEPPGGGTSGSYRQTETKRPCPRRRHPLRRPRNERAQNASRASRNIKPLQKLRMLSMRRGRGLSECKSLTWKILYASPRICWATRTSIVKPHAAASKNL